MLAVERTHPLRRDRDWLPRAVRHRPRWISGSVLAGGGLAAAGAIALSPLSLLLWKAWLLGGASLAFAAKQAGGASFRRQLSKLARGEIALSDVATLDDDELVRVHGVIEAGPTLRGLLLDVDGVYRRLRFHASKAWIHEAAVDFALLDKDGNRILIQAAGARWLVPKRETVTYPRRRFDEGSMPLKVRSVVAGRDSVQAIEDVLAVGEEVQIVGYKGTAADPGGQAMGYREAPRRASLRSGPQIPLIISRLRDVEPAAASDRTPATP